MMRRILGGIAVAGLIVAGSAMPASALTKSGTQNCSGGGATVAVRGEQQRIGDELTLTVAGVEQFRGHNVYVVRRDSGLPGTQTWSGNSVSLLLSGTYGSCEPPALTS